MKNTLENFFNKIPQILRNKYFIGVVGIILITFVLINRNSIGIKEETIQAKQGLILQTVKVEDFEGIETRTFEFKWMPGVVLPAEKTVVNFSIPNFYFHVSMMYALLRNKGVNLGKADFIGWNFN